MLTVALQFKPTIRRIQKPVKAKGVPVSTHNAPAAPVQSASKSFLQDVSKLQEDIANDDINGFYRTVEGQKVARKNARKKKRKNNDGQGTYIWSWDDDYDPAHPNDYETYLDSDEQLREQIEWQRKLDGKEEDDEEEEQAKEYQFRGCAPPEEYDEEEVWVPPPEDDSEYVPEPVADVAMDESVDDVYARRMRMAQEAGLKLRPPTPPKDQKPGQAKPVTVEDLTGAEDSISIPKAPQQPIPSWQQPPPPPPPPPPQEVSYLLSQPQQPFNFYDEPPSLTANAPGMQPTVVLPNPTISSEPVYYPSATISSQPVHYPSATISSDPVVYDTTQSSSQPPDDEPRGSHPGQKDFASRLMSKYGWQKGQSLGSSTQGLVTPLLAKHDKDRKGTGTIINRNKIKEDYGPFGKMTRCIVLANVVGLGEVDEDLADEIGQECREKVWFVCGMWGNCSMARWRGYASLRIRRHGMRRRLGFLCCLRVSCRL